MPQLALPRCLSHKMRARWVRRGGLGLSQKKIPGNNRQTPSPLITHLAPSFATYEGGSPSFDDDGAIPMVVEASVSTERARELALLGKATTRSRWSCVAEMTKTKRASGSFIFLRTWLRMQFGYLSYRRFLRGIWRKPCVAAKSRSAQSCRIGRCP